MADVLSELQRCGPALLIIFDILCFERSSRLCIGTTDGGLMDSKLISVKNNLIFKSIRFVQAMRLIKRRLSVQPDGYISRKCEAFQIEIVEQHLIAKRFDERGKPGCHMCTLEANTSSTQPTSRPRRIAKERQIINSRTILDSWTIPSGVHVNDRV